MSADRELTERYMRECGAAWDPISDLDEFALVELDEDRLAGEFDDGSEDHVD